MTSNVRAHAASWAPLASRSVVVGLLVLAWSLLSPTSAHASLLSPELEDTMADFLALFVLFVVPVGGIVVFWLLHIMPEKIAHQRHHPQFEAIRTLCLLSLVFGGLLWPIAWLWAYTKPVGYKMAYGHGQARGLLRGPARQRRGGAGGPGAARGLAEPSGACRAVTSRRCAPIWRRWRRGSPRGRARTSRWKRFSSGSIASSSG